MLRPVIFLWTISVNDMSLHLGSLVVRFMLWMHKSQPLWLVSDQVSTCWLAKSMVQHKTKQHKTHDNQHEMPPPHPPAALPSPSMGRPVAPPTHFADATKVPKQGVWHQVCTQRGWFPCSGCRIKTPWKSERREGSWPYGQNLIKTHNNQPEINDSGRRDIGERARRGLEHVGRCRPIIWVTIGTTKKYIRWITPRPKTAANWWGYTQQPTRNRRVWRSWYRRGGSTGGDHLGDVMPLFWVAIVINQIIKLKQIHC